MNEIEDDVAPQPSIDLETALAQMKEDGNLPDGFHMMFFSEEFSMKEDCPANQLLKKVGMKYGFEDTLRRQVFQLPNDKRIISYEFMWLGDFDLIQSTMERVDEIIQQSFDLMVKNKVLSIRPKGRIQFLVATSEEGVEE